MTTFALLPLLAALADTSAVPASACGADSMYVRAPVYVGVTVARAADTAASSGLLTIAQAVATRIRASLGASGDAVPRGDAVVAAADSVVAQDTAALVRSINALEGIGLRVVATRDGGMRWRPAWVPTGAGRSLATTALLERALGEAKAADETFIVPELFSADSLVFTLAFEQPTKEIGGVLRPVRDRPDGLAAFVIRRPLQRLAVAVPGTVQPKFPPELTSYTGIKATLTMSFVIDTSGRAEPSTLFDVWPSDQPRLEGKQGEAYNRFFAAATEAIVHGRFTPAELAGCKVAQRVDLPMTWSLVRDGQSFGRLKPYSP